MYSLYSFPVAFKDAVLELRVQRVVKSGMQRFLGERMEQFLEFLVLLHGWGFLLTAGFRQALC